MKYSEKLKDPRWQKVRLQILERDEWMCTQCFDGESTLHVHHLKYEQGKEPWECETKYLVTLCEECHEEYRIWRPEKEASLIQSLREARFSIGDLQDLRCLIGYIEEDDLIDPERTELLSAFYSTIVEYRQKRAEISHGKNQNDQA